ncbi:protein KTI12 homolog [Onthophagus taurus]|uniref:protein KTI12 homolog n=1 Tax=Onthophagus taurus TaxID=166361 RepID=UPI000C2010A6|nr:protein KTI12 homolog [Onthophagus taurus]
MPLIIITGVPSSGKTTRTNQLKEYFENEGKEVHIVSEYKEILKANFTKKTFYNDSIKEKHIRGLLKSEATKLLTPTNVVILDGSNYIKGYRYELYCATKANRSTQCTILTQINYEEAWKQNETRTDGGEKYDRETFDALILRYEEPDKKNRWDSPLFIVFPSDKINFQEISNNLFDKAPPPPNMSTQNAPLSSTNFLYELNKTVKIITDKIIKDIRSGVKGEITVPGVEDLTLDITGIGMQKIINLNRQYLTFSKMHTPDIEKVPQLYVQFLKANLN